MAAVGGFNEHIARVAVEKWLQEGGVIDAIFTGDDDSATSALAALVQAGKRVPEDAALERLALKKPGFWSLMKMF